MTTAKEHRFITKLEAQEKSESLKDQWELGYGIIYGPFYDLHGPNYYIVNELIEQEDRKSKRLTDEA